MCGIDPLHFYMLYSGRRLASGCGIHEPINFPIACILKICTASEGFLQKSVFHGRSADLSGLSPPLLPNL